MLHKINTSTGSNSNIMPDLMNFNIRAGHCQELKLFHAVYYYVRDKKYATPLLQNMAIFGYICTVFVSGNQKDKNLKNEYP